ncbi:MAG: 30S ribosomal protein S4 [Bacteriovoracaceae bacterium]|jgi:small subunit ribosomal protein S4|nr:30S ribosomal protein S4 [Bacteriovoracaceae bacterium]
MSRALTNRARFKIQRRLGLELPGLGKPGALERRPYPPGQHGQRRSKLSDYTIRLMEKQKIVFHYGVREHQLVKCVKLAKRDKSRAWVDTLVINLERRLDNAVFRLNFCTSTPAARQIVRHGHVMVNGKVVSVPGYILKKGDKISMTEKGYKTQPYMTALTSPRLMAVPACYTIETKGENEKTATLVDFPLPEDIPFAFSSQFVTEYYWKI